jgi:hypothetical protein
MIKKSDWKTEPLPNKKCNLGVTGYIWDKDAEKILEGYKPQDMDDKWFIYSESGWVYFVRSWTGHHIFGLKLHPTSAGSSIITESWVNSNPEEFNSPEKETNIKLIKNLLLSFFNVEIQA